MKASNSNEFSTGTALTVRVAQPHEVAGFDAQLADHHFLGAGRPVGDYLRQLVKRDGHAVALLVWGPSCYALKDRDLWIIWSASQRVERLKLIVQNRRFLLLGEIDIALRRERSAEDYRAALTSCREEIERLSRLSENLLALATADAGQKLLHLAPCDATAIALAVHARFARLAAEKNVTFTLAAPDTLPWSADALAIEQVLSNLISNALRHTPTGDRVELRVARETDTILFHVIDTGEGIPPAHLPLLFDRFHRVDKARSRASGGAGLGLAIVKTLVVAHGGTVTVTSELGQGTTFTCRFPSELRAC